MVGHDSKSLWFVSANSTVQVAIDCEPLTAQKFFKQESESLESGLKILDGDTQELVSNLITHRLLTLGQDREWEVSWSAFRSVVVESGARLVALADALLDYSTWRDGGALIVSGSEGLFLPRDPDVHSRRSAVRLFVAGLRPDARLNCYAFLVNSGVRSIQRDLTTLSVSKGAVGEVLASTTPVAVSLVGGRRWRLGSIGRLHVVQRLTSHRLPFATTRPIFRSTATYAVPNLAFQENERERQAWGTHFVASTAAAKAVSEAVERFAAGDIRRSAIVVAKAIELPSPYLDPRLVVRYSAGQYERHPRLRPFSDTDINAWVLASRGQHNNEHTFILADLVFYPFVPKRRNGNGTYTAATSSGMACAGTGTAARRAALLELVERDRFMSAWFKRSSPPHISDSSLPSALGELVIELRRHRDISLLNLSVRWCPVVCAVAESEREFMVAAAAGPASEAAQKALFELAASMLLPPPEHQIAPEEVMSPSDHQMLYQQRKFADTARFLTASTESVALRELPDVDLDAALSTSYFVKLTSFGFSGREVWRAVHPDLIPISFGWDLEPLDLPRVSELLKSSGQEPPLIPHPFA